MDIYAPREDSYLLQKKIQHYARGRVLDMGTGSGIQAGEAAKLPQVRQVVAVDVNEDAIQQLAEKKVKKITPIVSDLFASVSGQFDCIIFNPPYLPQDKNSDDPALYGGKHGWEISARFFQELSKHLTSNGNVLFLFSSLTNKQKIDEILEHNLFDYSKLATKKLYFETLYVYLIKKSPLRRQLETHQIEDITYFTHGKRGTIYSGLLEKKHRVKSHFVKSEKIKVAIKTEREDSEATERIRNEIFWVKKLKKQGIGPRILFSGDSFFVYVFVDGLFILDWIQNKSKREIKKVLLNILEQCYVLDTLGMNKQEMHHPFKHIIIDKDNHPTLIDFERAYTTKKPHNVTQFIECICRMEQELKKHSFSITIAELRNQAKQYKRSYVRDDFKQLQGLL
jgi:release factor glutamine methyltransferase